MSAISLCLATSYDMLYPLSRFRTYAGEGPTPMIGDKD